MARAYQKKVDMAREGKSKERIITPKATQEITILFHQKLNGAWTTFTEYPRSKLKTLYACFIAQHFKQKQLDKEVKKAFVEYVKHHYSDWMFHIKNPILSTLRKKIVTRKVFPQIVNLSSYPQFSHAIHFLHSLQVLA